MIPHGRTTFSSRVFIQIRTHLRSDTNIGERMAEKQSTKGEPRFFGRSQRLVLYAASGGCCEHCGDPLTSSFHADHVVPHAFGGPTDVSNGAALCAHCNTGKGVRFGSVPLVSSGTVDRSSGQAVRVLSQRSLRSWQSSGLVTYRALRAAGQDSILTAACPGAGKMAFGCLAVREELMRGADCVIVLVPTEQLKQQWAKVAAEWGITLTADWTGAVLALPTDVHGVVLSYSQVASLPDAIRLLCARKSTVVILDELHHCGRSLKWGEAVYHAAEHARVRLGLTGTAWRSDGLPIPFVACDDSSAVLADIRYSYRQALADGVVRPAFFFAFGGRFEWTLPTGLWCASFDDPLGEAGQARRLRAALDPNGGWLKSVVTQAVAAIRAMRQTHARAKGLVNCVDAIHARAVAGLIAEILGERPALALFDDPKAAAVLTRFRSDDAPILVACRMGTEGYDAPDLRLLVWASNITSELYFWQTVGRLLRIVPNLPYQDALILMPADHRLVAMAERFADEPGVRLRGEYSSAEGGRRAADPDVPRIRSITVHSEATEPLIVTAGRIISEDRLSDARNLKASRPHLGHLPAHHIAAELAQVEAGEREFEDLAWEEQSGTATTHDASASNEAATIQVNVVPELYDEKRARLRRECNHLAERIAQGLGLTSGRVHQIFGRHLGFRQADATIVQLQAKADLLRQRVLELGASGERLGTSSEKAP
jgi:superfamily II DNA or RNA helicase